MRLVEGRPGLLVGLAEVPGVGRPHRALLGAAAPGLEVGARRPGGHDQVCTAAVAVVARPQQLERAKAGQLVDQALARPEARLQGRAGRAAGGDVVDRHEHAPMVRSGATSPGRGAAS
jgi:hypothetical protein